MSTRVFNVNARSNTRRGWSSRTLIKGIQKVFLDLKNQQYFSYHFFSVNFSFLTFSMKILILLESILIYVKNKHTPRLPQLDLQCKFAKYGEG